jgi:pimeloyl-ACP methyl ester carboxylesterase
MNDALLLHAGIADSRMWEPQKAALEAVGRRVLAPDLRGFGSRPYDSTKFSHVEDVAGLLEAPAAVIGCALGGRIALELAATRPNLADRLVLIAPGLPGWQWSEETKAGWAEEETAWERGDLDAAAEANVRMWIDGPRRTPDEVDPEVRKLVHEMVLRSYELDDEDAAEIELDPPVKDRLDEIRCPTLLVVGSEDVADMHAIVEHLSTRIAGARVERIDGAGHLPGLERPDELNRILLEFLGE